jgi:hypothetical protein
MAEQQETAKAARKIRLFQSKGDAIITGVIILIILLVLLSPKIFLVKTAKWNDWSKRKKADVETAMGVQNTEARFRLYFQYYNVVHELGHGLIIYNHGVDIPIADEEQLVNDFAVAYWKYFGEPEKMDELYDIVTYAVEHIGDNYQNGVDYLENARAHSDDSSFDADFFNFNDYGWFQFSCVKHSIEQDKSLEDVLHEMGIQNAKLPEKKILAHNMTDEAESTAVVNEAVDQFHQWGLNFPETHQSFSSDPNSNYSKPFKNILGIYHIL